MILKRVARGVITMAVDEFGAEVLLEEEFPGEIIITPTGVKNIEIRLYDGNLQVDLFNGAIPTRLFNGSIKVDISGGALE